MFQFLRDWWQEHRYNTSQGDAEHISYWSMRFWHSRGWR